MPLSRWCEEDATAYEPNPAAMPVEPTVDDLIIFSPEVPGDVQLHNRWYLRRRLRMMVPAPVGTPMPDKERCPEKKARLFSVYMRPWVLDRANACPHGHVVHLADLNLVESAVKVQRRLSSKQCGDKQEIRSYAQAWTRYLRGRVVSAHAVRVITQFMAACCGKSSKDDDATQPSHEELHDLPDNSVSLGRVHRLLDALSLKADTKEGDGQHAGAQGGRGRCSQR